SVHAQQRIESPREAGSYQRGERGRAAKEQTGRPPDLCLGRGDKNRIARAEPRSRSRICAHARQCPRAHERSRALLSVVWPETPPVIRSWCRRPATFTRASNTAGGIAFDRRKLLSMAGAGKGAWTLATRVSATCAGAPSRFPPSRKFGHLAHVSP